MNKHRILESWSIRKLSFAYFVCGTVLIIISVYMTGLAGIPSHNHPSSLIHQPLSFLPAYFLFLKSLCMHTLFHTQNPMDSVQRNTFLIDPMYSKGIKSYPICSNRSVPLNLDTWTLKYLYIFIYIHRPDAFYKDGSPIVYVIETPLDILLVCFHPWMVNWWSLIHRPVPFNLDRVLAWLEKLRNLSPLTWTGVKPCLSI